MSEQANMPENQALIVTRKWWQSLWFWLLFLGVVLYILVYWYQSGSVIRDANYQYRAIVAVSDDTDLLTLDMLYPQSLRLDSTPASSQTVAIALWYAVPPTRTQPYTVTFTIPVTPVIVTDRTGNRIVPQFVITPGIGKTTPVVFYIRRALLSEIELAQVTPTLKVQSPLGTNLEIFQVFKPISLEQRSSAHWRRFWSLIFAPTTPLLVGAAGLVALAAEEIRHWTRRVQEQRRVAALAKVRSLASALTTDLSEAARRYTIYQRQTGVIWKDKYLQGQLREVWQEAPEQLRHTVELLGDLIPGDLIDEEHFYNIARRVGPKCSVGALEWAYEHLDDDWRQKARDGLLVLSQHPEYSPSISSDVLRAVEQKYWRAILRIWPHLSLWRGFPPIVDPELTKGLRCLGLEHNPFGSGQAETDTLLLTCRVDPPWLKELHRPQPALLVGATGSGKTATALLLAYDSLRDRDGFPVYCLVTSGAFELDEIARILAQTLLHYLAVAPAGFLKRGVAGESAIAHLLARYARPNLALHFHQAGLPLTGNGAKMLRELEALTGDSSSQEPLSDDELLALLSEARPHSFEYTMILLDVQEQTSIGEAAASDVCLGSLLDLSEALARIGVFVKTFLPNVFQEHWDHHSSQPLIALQWPDDYIYRLLEERLKFVDGLADWYDPKSETTSLLRAWCDPKEGELSPDSRLVSAAQSTPGGLMRKGNELLRRIGQTQHRLTAQDLDEILGPWPAQSNETES
ncbi:MAG TPA: hypothetical protein EYP49_10435 [Anaerolineae bacterium]|nr:hypothetical protein [Anaerolineae bacterium]